MNNRDELAREIFIADNHLQPQGESLRDWAALRRARGTNTYAHKIADGLLAAGYRKAQEVTSSEELDKLPPLSVVLDKHGESFQKMETDEGAASPLWCSGDIVLSDLIDLPATVLHEGTL